MVDSGLPGSRHGSKLGKEMMQSRHSESASADQILGEPHDQVVIHGHQHPLAERSLAPACAPPVRYIAALSVQPLSWAILVE